MWSCKYSIFGLIKMFETSCDRTCFQLLRNVCTIEIGRSKQKLQALKTSAQNKYSSIVSIHLVAVLWKESVELIVREGSVPIVHLLLPSPALHLLRGHWTQLAGGWGHHASSKSSWRGRGGAVTSWLTLTDDNVHVYISAVLLWPPSIIQSAQNFHSVCFDQC